MIRHTGVTATENCAAQSSKQHALQEAHRKRQDLDPDTFILIHFSDDTKTRTVPAELPARECRAMTLRVVFNKIIWPL